MQENMEAQYKKPNDLFAPEPSQIVPTLSESDEILEMGDDSTLEISKLFEENSLHIFVSRH